MRRFTVWFHPVIVFAERHDTNTTPEDRLERLADLPPSAKLIYWVLEREGPLTQAELIEQTLLPRRTVREATTKLRDADILEAEPCPPDARKKQYRLHKVAEREAPST